MDNIPPFSLALVTGATSGIGEELSRLFAKKGINLLLSGRNQEKLEALKGELSGLVKVEMLQADLNQPQERNRLIEKIHKLSPDLVVNNAGVGMYGDALCYPTQDSLDLVEVDVKAVLELSLEAARTLISLQKTGVILNVSSTAAFPIFPGFSVYAASKAFLNKFSESFDEEVRPYGVRVLAACPGVVATHFRERAGGRNPSYWERKQTMSVAFAAQEIWKQIEKRKKIHLFNWVYRLLITLTMILPKPWVAKLLHKIIGGRHIK